MYINFTLHCIIIFARLVTVYFTPSLLLPDVSNVFLTGLGGGVRFTSLSGQSPDQTNNADEEDSDSESFEGKWAILPPSGRWKWKKQCCLSPRALIDTPVHLCVCPQSSVCRWISDAFHSTTRRQLLCLRPLIKKFWDGFQSCCVVSRDLSIDAQAPIPRMSSELVDFRW